MDKNNNLYNIFKYSRSQDIYRKSSLPTNINFINTIKEVHPGSGCPRHNLRN